MIQYKQETQHPETEQVNKARKNLIHLLELRLDRQLQRIFRFLGIKYPPNDIDPVFNSILHGKEEQRIHAIEFLDNILDNHLKKELISVVESSLTGVISEEKIKRLNLKVLSEIECYNELLGRKDVKLKLAVLQLIEASKNKKFYPLIESLLNDPNEKVRIKSEAILLSLS